MADESDVDEWVRDSTARGYEAFLVPGKDDEMPDRPMKDRLRSDVAPRRKVDQQRPR